MRRIILALVASLLCYCGSLRAQESSTPATTPSTQDSSKPNSPDQGSSSSKTKSRAIPSFLILGTVFNENAISFPDVQVRIRRAGEKKFRWDAYTNSRGEFAVRVPPGYEYEVVTHTKKYEDQSQTVDSKVDVQQRLSIKLQPKGQTKTGARP